MQAKTNGTRIRIVLDAMGGDFAPQATVQGSIDALNRSKNRELDIILLGDKKRINNILKSQFQKKMFKIYLHRHAPDRKVQSIPRWPRVDTSILFAQRL